MSLSSDPGLRRVCIQAGTEVVDVTLPAAVPVAALLPSIVDVLDGDRPTESAVYQLSQVGAAALPASTTLAESGIRDGTVLLLTRSTTALPAPRHDDVAAGVAASINTTDRPDNGPAMRLAGALSAGAIAVLGGVVLVRNGFGPNTVGPAGWVCAASAVGALLVAGIAQRLRRDRLAGLTLSVVATVFAATAGLLAVPGAPSALLAGTGAAVTAVVAMRVTGRDSVSLTAISAVSVVTSIAALAGEVTGAPWRVIGPVAALASLGLLGMATRAAIVLAGLSPTLDTRHPPDGLTDRVIRVEYWMAGLVAAFSSTAAGGAVIAALTARAGAVFAAATGVLLLVRARCGGRAGLVYLVTGTGTLGATFAMVAAGELRDGPWLAATTAMSVAAAVGLGFIAPAVTLSPFARRGLDLAECLILIAMAPLTCWLCGVLGAVRTLGGLDLP